MYKIFNSDTNQNLIEKYCSNEFLEHFKGLPGSQEGSWKLHQLKFVLGIANFKEFNNILEIGFNRGRSASLWLEFFPNSTVTSVDIDFEDKNLRRGVEKVIKKYDNRFTFVGTDSKSKSFNKYIEKQDKIFDLLFVDGDHSYNACLNDLMLSQKLGIRHVIIDNVEYQSVIMALTEFKHRLIQKGLYFNVVEQMYPYKDTYAEPSKLKHDEYNDNTPPKIKSCIWFAEIVSLEGVEPDVLNAFKTYYEEISPLIKSFASASVSGDIEKAIAKPAGVTLGPPKP